MKKITAEFVKSEARRITGQKSIDAQALLASAFVGPNVSEIMKFLGLSERSRTNLTRMAALLERNGIWLKNGKIAADWFGKDGGLAFNIDLCVARGLLQRTDSEAGR